MADDAWGFADIYGMDDEGPKEAGDLADITGDDWRNILVLGRATHEGVYPETLALVGRARYLADELGCRVEVLLIGEDLEAATKVLQRYPINTVYRIQAPDYAPIDQTSKILEAVVKKRRPELVMAFQSRTGDAITAYTGNRLGVGFVIGAIGIEIDTYERRVRATHQASNTGFHITTEFHEYPQFVSVQRGLFRAPMEDPYASVDVHDLDIDAGRVAHIEVLKRDPPHPFTLADAARVVIAGSRCHDAADVDAARGLAKRIDAAFGVTRSVVDRGLGDEADLVGERDRTIRPDLVIAVGCRGSLEFTQAIKGDPTIAAIGSDPDDPMLSKAAYFIPGDVQDGVAAFMKAL